MTPAELVERDWLLEHGLDDVYPWHLRCLQAYLAAGGDGVGRPSAHMAEMRYRLHAEMTCRTMDEMHALALHEHERRLRRR